MTACIGSTADSDAFRNRRERTGVGESGPRMKDLLVPLFGADRQFGAFPTTLHSDMRHLIEMLRRGKQARLDEQRMARLERALADDGAKFKSILELRSQMEEWRAESQRAFDANAYYDASRAKGYTDHNRGSQEALTLRALQFSSLKTDRRRDSSAVADGLLAIDLGCGTGLSTGVAAALPATSLAVIGVDLSEEMLHSDEWAELVATRMPMAGERVRCDLAQPLPFRRSCFDVAYSVAAVHYLTQDSQQRSAEDKMLTFLTSLRSCLSSTARPCTFQAFFTREPSAKTRFAQAAEKAGWSLCDLVVDHTYGGKGAERDFLYVLPTQPLKPGPMRPPRCALYDAHGATCALALESWALQRGIAEVQLDSVHRAWLECEHLRFAKRMVRLHDRCDAGRRLDEAKPLDAAGSKMAKHLAVLLSEHSASPEDCLPHVLDSLHSP
mmetsp:Transcript_34374/g.67688  ORF Transcript_34374/g.67688 Transcript_34374/m.67688 type:complete len:441 (-) Transcript_34374:7-1329(-)